jgi:RND family efflux transporter MFP subunit
MRAIAAAGLLGLALLPLRAGAADGFAVTAREVADQKAVFATVESANVVPARARIGGTIAELRVGYGDKVTVGTPLATVGDQKLVLQVKALDAQIQALQAQLAQAQTDLARAEDLARQGAIPRVRLDEARTAANVAGNQLKARTAERSVVSQQMTEGAVLAPATGRVLKVPVTVGTVIMPGEPVAQIAEESYVLRLRVPERHARFMKTGDEVRIDGAAAGAASTGRIVLVYPQIEDGRVVADAKVEGIGDYFVGERIRVWVSAGTRQAFVVPQALVATRSGVDYVRLQRAGAGPVEVPVQRGLPRPLADLPDGIELLSGVADGDVLVAPGEGQ